MAGFSLTVALAQIAPVWLDRAATLAKVNSYVEQAARQGCGLVAFGEALRPSFKDYARSVVDNAKILAETLKARGFDLTK